MSAKKTYCRYGNQDEGTDKAKEREAKEAMVKYKKKWSLEDHDRDASHSLMTWCFATPSQIPDCDAVDRKSEKEECQNEPKTH